MLVFTSLKMYGIQLLKNIITHETLQSITVLCCNLHQISNSLNSCFHNLLIGLGLSRQGFKPRSPARKANTQPLTHPSVLSLTILRSSLRLCVIKMQNNSIFLKKFGCKNFQSSAAFARLPNGKVDTTDYH